MKIALQLGLIPGQNPSDKAKWARDHGVEGIELGVFGVSKEKLRQQADEINGVVPICSVCANATPEGTAVFDFLHPEKAKRRASIDGSKEVLKFCGEVGAVGQIVPPIFGPAVVPDLSPYLSIAEIEDGLMIAALQELGPIAAEHKTLFMLEPLNRYEQHYLRKQADGIRLIEAANRFIVGLFSHAHRGNRFAARVSRGQGLHQPHSSRRQHAPRARNRRYRLRCELQGAA